MSALRRLALALSSAVGTPQAFLLALLAALGWAVVGALTGFGDAWLLWPSAIASVLTFVVAFSLQYTQNRDTRAIQLKLDEILRAQSGASDELIKLERRSDSELSRVEAELLEQRDAPSDR